MSKFKSLGDLLGAAADVGRKVIGTGSSVDKEALAAIRRGENLAENQTIPGALRRYRMDQRVAARAKKKELKDVNPSLFRSLPRTAKFGIPAAGAAGAFMLGSRLMGGADTPEYDWTKLNFPTPGEQTPAEKTAQDQWIAAREKAIRDAFSYSPTIPGQEVYDGMSQTTNQLGAATLQQMMNLANQYGQGAATIKDRGAAAGQDINDIYGAGAGAMEALASQPSSEYDSMIPVAGAAATNPEFQRMTGGALADYLTQNQLIDAQAQGGMAQLAQMLGPAYANQYALMDRQARMAAEANKANTMSNFEMQRQQDLAQALGELNMSAADAEYQRQLEAAQQPQLPVMSPAEYDTIAASYDEMDQRTKNYYAQTLGIRDAYDWVEYQVKQLQQQYGQQ